MKETTPSAMPSCFERWCQRFDDVFTHKAQKRAPRLRTEYSARKAGLSLDTI